MDPGPISLNNKSFKEIQVDPKYHKHIIGNAGANVNRLCDETGVIISVKDGNPCTIHLEGSQADVQTAAECLLEQVSRLKNAEEQNVFFPQRCHTDINIIGTNGEKIREIRDRFNQVQIYIPAPGQNRDWVTLRGPKKDVDRCANYMRALIRKVFANYARLEYERALLMSKYTMEE